jgi:hypothetical protein
MPSERGVLLRRAAVTALLAGGMGAGVATVAIAATHGSAPSTSASTTAATPSASPSSKPTTKPTHNCPNMGGQSHGSPGTHGSAAMPGQPNG